MSSDEFLNYAMINRKELESKGRDMVKRYLELYELEFGEGGECTECTYRDAEEFLDA